MLYASRIKREFPITLADEKERKTSLQRNKVIKQKMILIDCFSDVKIGELQKSLAHLMKDEGNELQFHSEQTE